MTKQYREFIKKQEEEIAAFPLFFAFSVDQFKEAMEERGLKETDKNKIVSIGGGGFVLKEDAKPFFELLGKQASEREEMIESDVTGDGFVYEMFRYELANHEYGYTQDVTDTLNALGYTLDDINDEPKLFRALTKARRDLSKEGKEEN